MAHLAASYPAELIFSSIIAPFTIENYAYKDSLGPEKVREEIRE